MKFSIAASALALSTAAVSVSPMGTGKIVVRNLAPSRGIFFTPLWVAIHDGNFDIYNRDEPSSDALERLAEDGTTDDISRLFDAGNIAGNIFDATLPFLGPVGPGPIGPGDVVEFQFDVEEPSSGNLYFSYATMVIPSNDAFIANGNERAHLLYSKAEGRFTNVDIIINGSMVLDAGTEVNDEIPENVAFSQQVAPDTGVEENGVIVAHPGFGQGPGFVGPAITSFGPTSLGDFTNSEIYPNGIIRIQVVFDIDDDDSRNGSPGKKGNSSKGKKGNSSKGKKGNKKKGNGRELVEKPSLRTRPGPKGI